jgi:hypothetical protein
MPPLESSAASRATSFGEALLGRTAHLTLVDISLACDLKCDTRITAIEGPLPASLHNLVDRFLDVILCVSVLEHLWEPLEFSAFRLGLSAAEEMDDQKMYYDPRDMWPLLVRAGFRPSRIRCFSHEFGLNTFAICNVE